MQEDFFDGVSAILGIRRASTFEGEASTALEFAAEAWRKQREMQKKNPEENLKIRMSEKEDIPEGTGISEASEDERKFILNTGEIVAYLVGQGLQERIPGSWLMDFTGHWQMRSLQPVRKQSGRPESGKWH